MSNDAVPIPFVSGSDLLGPCRLLQLLGSGGTGQVFLAELVEDRPYARAGTRVAVKVLHTSLFGNEVSERRFAQEAEIGTSVRHPCVVRAYEAGATDSGMARLQFLILEYVEGITLRALMDQLHPIPEPLLRAIGARVARGLAAIHAAGVVHRDLKPENILITPSHEVKVMDLGVAHIVAQTAMRLTQTGTFVGTITYAAPEQLAVDQITEFADLYSLGVVLFEAAVGSPPFDGARGITGFVGQLDNIPPRVSSIDSRITPFLDLLIAQLLAKEPSQRFASAEALAETLEQGETSSWWKTRSGVAELETAVATTRIPVSRGIEFVGRENELAMLHRTLGEVVGGGRARLVVIDGEAGIGKTRLVDEFVRVAVLKRPRIVVLYGSYSSASDGLEGLEQAASEYWAAAGLSPATSTAAAPAPQSDDAARAEQPRVERPSDDAVQGSFIDLARTLSARRPIIWIVDDLQFATEDSHRIVLAMAHHLFNSPVMLVVAMRGTRGDLQQRIARVRNARRIPLEKLQAEDVIALLSKRLSRQSVAQDVGAIISRRADGNPLIISEMLLTLEERGGLRRLEEEPAAVDRELRDLTLPPTVHDMVLARLRELSEWERTLLDVAAIDGVEFDPDLVARVLGAQRLRVLQSLATIERRGGLIHASGPHFRFDSPQLHEVIDVTMPSMLRAEYHVAFADAYLSRAGLVDTAAGDVRGAAAVYLAEHLLKGDAPARGVRYVVAALDHLADQYARDRTAVELAERALTALSPKDTALRCDIQIRRAAALARLARPADAVAAANDARAAAESLDDLRRRAQAELALGRALMASADYDGAARVLTEAIELTSTCGDERTDLEAAAALARLHHLTGRFVDARAGYEKVVALAQHLGDVRAECRALDNLGNILLALDDHDAAEACLHREVLAAKEHGLSDSEMLASFGLGVIAMWRGDYESARQYLERQLTLSRGYPTQTVLGLAALAEQFHDMGALDHAEEHLSLALERAEAGQLRHIESYLRLTAGEIHRARGKPEDAEAAYRESLAIARSLGALHGVAEATLALGRLLLELGRVDEARDSLRESAQLVHDLHLATPGLLPTAYLATIGERPMTSVGDVAQGACRIRAELHLVLYRAGLGAEHLGAAGVLLSQMSHHLSEQDAARFWRTYPNAKAYEVARRKANRVPAEP